MNCALMLLVAVGLLTITTSVYGESCTTPLGASSSCISIYQCREIISALQYISLTGDVVSFLRHSFCGFDSNNTPKVCCGSLPSTMNPSPSSDPVSNEDSSVAPSDSCGKEANDNRIIGGTATDLDEFPWLSLLGYLTPLQTMKYSCGGTLINHRYVLTAAHCVVGEVEKILGQLTTVRLGEYNTKTERDCINNDCAEPVQDLLVQRAYPHSGYADKDTTRKDDIALVRLATRARYSDFVQPICVLGSSAPLTEGTVVHVVGWGRTLNGANSDTKQKLTMKVFKKSSCDEKYRVVGATLTQRQMCAGGKFGEDACSGDSGGPLMVLRGEGYWQIVGVVSFGYGCGKDNWPGVYTSVSPYVEWIQTTLRDTNN